MFCSPVASLFLLLGSAKTLEVRERNPSNKESGFVYSWQCSSLLIKTVVTN